MLTIVMLLWTSSKTFQIHLISNSKVLSDPHVKTLASVPSPASSKNGKSKYRFPTEIVFV